MSTPDQIKVIHTLKTRTGLDDEDYRALLGTYGVSSSKLLLNTQAIRLISTMRKLPGARAAAPSATKASGPYAPILQALWISAFNLGLVRSRDDRSMMRFVERQTDLSHTRFLVDKADAMRAIEGLKAWMRRDGGVVWPKTGMPGDKRAVCEAIARRLEAKGGFTPSVEGVPIWPADVLRYGVSLGLPVTFELYRDPDWDALSNALGRRLRGTLAALARKTQEQARGQ